MSEDFDTVAYDTETVMYHDQEIDISVFSDKIKSSIKDLIRQEYEYNYYGVDDIVANITDLNQHKVATTLLVNAIEVANTQRKISTAVVEGYHPFDSYIITKAIPRFIEHSLTFGMCGVQPIAQPLSYIYMLRMNKDGDRISLAIQNAVAETSSHKLCSIPLLEIQNKIQDDFYIENKLISCIDALVIKPILAATKIIDRLTSPSADKIYFAINRTANAIAMESRRSAGNAVLISHNVFEQLCIAGHVELSYNGARIIEKYNEEEPILEAGNVGTLTNSSIKLYVCDWSTIDPELENDIILVGYSGNQPVDAGAIYSPYETIQATISNDDMVIFTSKYNLYIDDNTSQYYGTIILE